MIVFGWQVICYKLVWTCLSNTIMASSWLPDNRLITTCYQATWLNGESSHEVTTTKIREEGTFQVVTSMSAPPFTHVLNLLNDRPLNIKY